MILRQCLLLKAMAIILLSLGCSPEKTDPATYSSSYSLRDNREDKIAFPFVISGEYLRCSKTPFWGLWIEEIVIDGEVIEPVWHPESKPHYELGHLYNQGKELNFQEDTIYTYYVDRERFDFAMVKNKTFGYIRYELPDNFNNMKILYYIRGAGVSNSALSGPHKLYVSGLIK